MDHIPGSPAGDPGGAVAGPHRDVYTVSRLNREVKGCIAEAFGGLWVEGEISNLARPGSGHWYFSLKDQRAQVRCAMFRRENLRVARAPRDGEQVLVRARVSLYEARGDYQIIVEHLEPAGEGALRLAFEQLKQKLHAEALFDSAHKRPLPALPHRVGVLTSPTGAAVRDILHVFARRFPGIDLLVYAVPVQGPEAPARIRAQLARAVARAECDVLLLARGGGSLEDLWAFNDEALARAIHACPLPVVTGIGHEVDFTIADFVADQRAPTPSAAAELLSPDQAEIAGWLSAALARFVSETTGRVRATQQRLDLTARRLVHPRERLVRTRQRLAELEARLVRDTVTGFARRQATLTAARSRLTRASPALRIPARRTALGYAERTLGARMTNVLERRRARLETAIARLNAVSPEQTLQRGYAILTDVDGAVLRDAARVAPGTAIHARLARGQLEGTVTRTLPQPAGTEPGERTE